MTVLGAHVPVSWWTVLVFAAGAVAAGLASRPLAARSGWPPLPTRMTLLMAALVLALTITPGDRAATANLDGCLPESLREFFADPLHTSGGVAGAVLNVVLLLPLGMAGVLATGRASWGTGFVVFLPAVSEVTQNWLPDRTCSTSDFLTNVVGGLIGVALGGLAVRRQRVLTNPRT